MSPVTLTHSSPAKASPSSDLSHKHSHAWVIGTGEVGAKQRSGGGHSRAIDELLALDKGRAELEVEEEVLAEGVEVRVSARLAHIERRHGGVGGLSEAGRVYLESTEHLDGLVAVCIRG